MASGYAALTRPTNLGYLRTATGSGLTALYRHYNATSGDYLLNTSVTPPSGYVMQASLGYIFTAGESSGGGVYQDLVYNYDNSGNVTSIDDYAFSASRLFSYDALGRLTQAVGFFGNNQALVTHDYSYNAIGNILNKGGVAFTYGDAMHPSAVTAISSGKTYSYDANGNMLSGGNRNFVWDVDNRVNSVAVGGLTTSMYYDYSGARVRKDGSGITLYPFQGYEIDPNGVITKFIRIGGESIASNKGTSKYFYHNDHLGSVNVVTDINGSKVQLTEYDPWGAVSRSEGSIDPDQRFTGQKLDPETGLYYYGGRYYDAEIGRFISADPFVQTIFDPQNLNRYSYVVNNPQNYADPDGYFHQVKKQKKHGGFFRSFFGMFVGAIVGILSGGAGMPAVLAGAIGGFTAGAVNTAINGGNPLRNILGGSFLGGLGGAIGGAAFNGLGGNAAAGFTMGNFGAAVGAGAIAGAVTGAVSTGIYGGKFGRNVGFGALGSVISAAVVYGGFAAWDALNGGGAQTANSGRGGLQFAGTQDAIEKLGLAESMSDAPKYASNSEPDTLLGGALIGSGMATVGTSLAIGKATVVAWGTHLAADTLWLGALGRGFLFLHDLSLGANMLGFGAGTAFVGGFMIGEGINQLTPPLRSGAIGRLFYDAFHPAK